MTLACLGSGLELALELSAVSELLRALAVFLPIDELTLVDGAITLGEDAVAGLLAVLPGAFVVAPIGIHEPSLSIDHILTPEPFKDAPIYKHHSSFASAFSAHFV